MRRYLAAGIWLAMTAVATFIVWEAVSVVAADVTDRPAPVVEHRDVVVALQAGSSQAATTTTTTIPASTTTTPHVSSPPTTVHAAPPTTAAPAPGVPSGPSFGSATTTVPVSPPTTKATGHPVVPTTLAPPVGGTATYSTDGGVVGVGCTSFDTIRLLAALPNDGFQALVSSSSGLFVQVNFIGQGQNIPVGAGCVFGQPFQIKENHS